MTTLQAGQFLPLGSKEEILALIAEEERHNADLTAYLWYIMPVADRFGERAYDVAAEALRGCGLTVTGEQLKALAQELRTPAGLAKYAEERRLHVMSHVCG
jgi:hypothetical protein